VRTISVAVGTPITCCAQSALEAAEERTQRWKTRAEDADGLLGGGLHCGVDGGVCGILWLRFVEGDNSED